MSLSESSYSVYLFIWKVFIEYLFLLGTVSGMGKSSELNKVSTLLELSVVISYGETRESPCGKRAAGAALTSGASTPGRRKGKCKGRA